MHESRSVYQTASDPAPESDFEPGTLHHLVVGNTGRLLDSRRTPVSVVGLRPEVGFAVLRIENFEDKGACWEVPFEGVDRYQFARGEARATPRTVTSFREAAARFDRPLRVECDPQARADTEPRLARERLDAAQWMETASSFFAQRRGLPDPAHRDGDPRLYRDLREFMTSRGLWEIEDAFTRQYVCNPHSGELVKGHRIVIAELGLVPYAGSIVRAPDLFDGPWSRRRRADHVLARMAFVHAVFSRLGLDRVILFRGVYTETPVEPRDDRTFVSATFCREVAMSHFKGGSPRATRTLTGQAVPVERLFMTYYETASMNEHFREAEAVLFTDQSNLSF